MKLQVLAALAIGGILGVGAPVTEALEIQETKQQFRPPEIWEPPTSSGGGTRGSLLPAMTATPLLPDTNRGLTVSDSPEFWVYLPQVGVPTAEFGVLDEEGNEVYRTSLKLPEAEGILSLRLPEGENSVSLEIGKTYSLEIGKTYNWFLVIAIDPEDPSQDWLLEGWVQRVEADSTLLQALEDAEPEDRPTLYAEAGIWYEAIATLAQLRRADPDDPALVERWQVLLESVQLEALAQEPLLEGISLSEVGEPDSMEIEETPWNSGNFNGGGFRPPENGARSSGEREGGGSR